MLDALSTTGNVILMIVGFGLIIAIHELGHFLAARWAGIRVNTFAVGFGQAICTWRKGLGFRWGSSEPEYNRILARRDARSAADVPEVSPTEYRLNWFPFGGYVKMLGQEDVNPGATSTEPDSFTAKPVWKRMIVISGGVVMNLILAGVLFVIAYSVGIREIRPLIGYVAPDSGAQRAGFLPGDRVLSINGERVHTFNDIALTTALGARGEPLTFEVLRPGHDTPITLTAVAKAASDGTLQVGVGPARAASIHNVFVSRAERREFLAQLPLIGLDGVRPGMNLVAIDGAPIPHAGTDDALAIHLENAVRASNGRPLTALFKDEASSDSVTVTIQPRPEFQTGLARIDGASLPFAHLLGLVPAAPVIEVQEGGRAAGLQVGDLLARVGAVDWPSVPDAIDQIRALPGGVIDLVVLRDGQRIPLTARVDAHGRIGFRFAGPADAPAILARTPTFAAPDAGDPADLTTDADARPQPFVPPAAARLAPPILAGSRVLAVGGAPVESFADIRAVMRDATRDALAAGTGADVPLALSLPVRAGASDDAASAPEETITLSLTPDEVRALHALAWEADDLLSAFAIAQFTDVARNPLEAVGKGIRKTHQVITSTYLTFLRLFQRSVPADQLRGPVGITHIGSRVASQGFVYLMFFLGLISANLAVINFLPLPIVDGGLFVFLLIEAITRKPVSVAVQNIATLIGLVLIGGVFLFVTFNDLMRLWS